MRAKLLKTKKILTFFSALYTNTASQWGKRGEKMALDLFRLVVSTTPAYHSFLKKNHANEKKIKTIEDFKALPLTSKDIYLCATNYINLFPNRDITSASTVSATSGSTDEPFYFPRNGTHDDMYQHVIEVVLKDQFGIEKPPAGKTGKKTLVILGFGLGIWIGGIFTYKVLEQLSEKGYLLTTVPVGTNKEQFLRAIKKFAPYYDQTILMGYPPFIKDVLDEGNDYGIKWNDYEIKILTAAEGFSEKFREYIAKKSGVKNMFRDIVNIYGTVELGTMAHETTIGNLIRNLATKNIKLSNTLFPNATNTPTLCQYYPHLHYFEEVEIDGRNEIVGTGYGTHIPLIRYRFKDLGGVIPYQTMMEKLSACGIDIQKEMKRHGIDTHKIAKLPFVYVYARSDSAVVFRGANIYPEEIRQAIDDKQLSFFVTGRFTMIRKENRSLKQNLEINIELKKAIKPPEDLNKIIQNKIVETLKANNSEYLDQYKSDSKKATPVIKLWPHNHPLYFARTGKQAWVKK